MAFPGTTGQFVTAAEWNTMLQAIGLNGVTVPGWVDAQSAWVYVSAASFKVVGADVTNRYTVGTKLSCTDAAATKYFYVVSSAYAASDTTVTITGGADYALAGGAITNPRFSYVANPQGFPGFFNFTPGQTGWVAGVSLITSFTVQGRACFFYYKVEGTGTGTARAITAPFIAAQVVRAPMTHCYDNSAYVNTTGNYAQTNVPTSSTLTFYKTDSATWTNGNLSQVSGQIWIPI